MKIKDLSDKQLVAKEEKLRRILSAMPKNISEYELKYRAWFMLREAGLQRGLYKFFIPTREDYVLCNN